MSGVVIIGAGASGMMAAIAAAERGACVSVITGKTAPGKKILATGNGHCNFTNMRMKKECFHSSFPDGPMRVVRSFDNKALIGFFEDLGVLSCERDGYVYPKNMQAVTIKDALLRKLGSLKVQMINDAAEEILCRDNGFIVKLSSGKTISAGKVILCTGGLAAPATGSDGAGFRMLKKLGIRLVPTVPALSGFLSDDPCCAAWHGVRVHGRITAADDSGKTHSDTGELQLLKSGISGIPVFQISRHAAYGLKKNRSMDAVIDFMPEDGDALRRILSRREFTAEEALKGILPYKLADVIIKRSGVRRDAALSEADRKKIAEMVHSFRLRITDVRGYADAQTTAGGADLREIDLETMESRRIRGLYLAGEILDVDGICGGYNLQWAFSSGHLAGISAAASEFME